MLALALTTTVVAGGARPAAAKRACCAASCPGAPKDTKPCCRPAPVDKKDAVAFVRWTAAPRSAAVAVVAADRTSSSVPPLPALRPLDVLGAAPCGLSPPAALPA